MSHSPSLSTIKQPPPTGQIAATDQLQQRQLGALDQLQQIVEAAGPLRIRNVARYDENHLFRVRVSGVTGSGIADGGNSAQALAAQGDTAQGDTAQTVAAQADVVLKVEKYVGGGFAGQVYRVRLTAIEPVCGQIDGLEVGRQYAVKIIVPAGRFARIFRNSVYAMGFQGPFAGQVNPAAGRAGVLWQKIIGRAAELHFGRTGAVCDTYATFFDDGLGSNAEINEWVEGRQWKSELDDRYFERFAASFHEPSPHEQQPDFSRLGAPEFFAKKHFMARMVLLLHELGAPEFARQYEWSTAKSQPNVLKRLAATSNNPADGLCAIDFRAGLALLPFLPMSPGDFGLIWRGLKCGRLVQFDRGNLDQLERYIERHKEHFADLRPALEELKKADAEYRSSLPDITHHGLRPLWDGKLRGSIRRGFAAGWRARKLADNAHAARLERGGPAFYLFLMLGVVPILGRLVRRLWAHADTRRHLWRAMTSWSYMMRAMAARRAESLKNWVRQGRRHPDAAAKLAHRPVRYWLQALTVGLLPPTWHRFLVEWDYARAVLRERVAGFFLLLFDSRRRQKWLEDRIDEALADEQITPAEHAEVRATTDDPYMRTYLLCVAGHIATIPLTQVVSGLLGIIVAWWAYRFQQVPWEEAAAMGGGILVMFQFTPLSPGSVARGLITISVVAKKRNYRDFKVAVWLSFWKYIGYLAFPIQMATRYPVLARILAGRFARGAVSHVPVFGEHGALAERKVLDLFFNEPISMARHIREGADSSSRLVKRIALGGAWAVMTMLGWAMVALAALRAETAEEILRYAITGLIGVALALLSWLIWAIMAPSFSRSRRWWWAMILLPLGAGATLTALHWPTLSSLFS